MADPAEGVPRPEGSCVPEEDGHGTTRIRSRKRGGDMAISILGRRTGTTTATDPSDLPDLSGSGPLPVCLLAFEGVMGAAYDLTKEWDGAWMVLEGEEPDRK